jgi:hypothetical protein
MWWELFYSYYQDRLHIENKRIDSQSTIEQHKAVLPAFMMTLEQLKANTAF